MNPLIKRAYDAGTDAAKANFKLDAMPKTAPKVSIPGIQAPNPTANVSAMAQNTVQNETTLSPEKLLAPLAKHSDFNFGMTAKYKARPGEITLDNGTRRLGTNFMEPWRYHDSVGKAWDSMKAQMPQDFLNAGNEGSVGGPTT